MKFRAVVILAAVLLAIGSNGVRSEPRKLLAISVFEVFNVPMESQMMSWADGSTSGYTGLYFPAIDVRCTCIPGGLFAFASYGGAVASASEGTQFELSARVNLIGVGLGKSFHIAKATLDPRIGFSYSSWRYEVQRNGETYPKILDKGAGLIVGAYLSAPVTDAIELSFGYELLMRSAFSYSGRVPRGGAYTFDKNGKDSLYFVGIGYWVL